jgi:hypothetical protein
VVAEGELPHKQNRRRGAGWWMDLDGEWRAPEEWPQDYPPLDGWVRSQDGSWRSPTRSVAAAEDTSSAVLLAEQVASAPATKPVSRQAQADRRAMLTMMGALGGAALMLTVALILITQAGAENEESVEETSVDVIYAAETAQDRLLRQAAAAEEAPTLARTQLEELEIRASSGSSEAVDVDFGEHLDLSPAPQGQSVETGTKITIIGRQPDPILERVTRDGCGRLLFDQQQTRTIGGLELPPPSLVIWPTNQCHVHPVERNVRTFPDCFVKMNLASWNHRRWLHVSIKATSTRPMDRPTW